MGDTTMKKILFLVVVFMLSACASVKVTLYKKDVRYPATDPQSIEIFQKKPEGRQFIEIGEITVDGASTREQIERIFRIKAAEYGGNAVYFYKTEEHASTYVQPHECHFGDGFYYPHGRYPPYRHYYPYRGYYFPNYYYCYGYRDIDTVTFLDAVGIVIRYTQP
jgi:hypothetical protein